MKTFVIDCDWHDNWKNPVLIKVNQRRSMYKVYFLSLGSKKNNTKPDKISVVSSLIFRFYYIYFSLLV